MRSRTWVVLVCSGLVLGLAGLAGADCPDLVGHWPVPVQAVTAVGTTAYVGSGSTFVTLDVANPANPTALGSIVVPATIDRIAVSGSFAYVAADSAGLRVLDVSAAAHPVEVGHVDGPASDVAVAGTYVYVFDSGGVTIYDVGTPASPARVGSWHGPFAPLSPGRVVVSGEFAYVGGQDDLGWAVYAVRVSDPAHPVAVGSYRGPTERGHPFLTDLALAGSLLFAAEAGFSEVYETTSMDVLDVSNPASPTWLGGYGHDFSPSGHAVAASGPLVFLAGASELDVISIADPRNPALTSAQPLNAGVAPAAIAVAGHRVLVADREGGLYLFDDSACGASGCSLACTPAVPASAVAGTPVAFQGAVLQGECTGTPTFDWDFGDGSSHSSEPSPSHAYPFGGAFHWSVAVTLAGASCATSGTISVASNLPPISAPGSYAYVVPTSAHKPGYNGTNWVTDLVLTNPGIADSTARLYFIKGGRDNTGSPARPVIVPARRSLRLSDVVAGTFSESSASGAIVVGSDVPLIVTSRTYNDALTGTYGQGVEGVPAERAFGPGPSAWLTGLSQSASDTLGFRTNIGVVNAGPQHVRVEIMLYGGDGVWLATKTVDLNPYDFQQVDKVFAGLAPSGVDNGYALVSSATPGAVLFAYASVIDNGTGDPIAVGAVVPPGLP